MSTSTINVDERTYGRLLERTLPRVIRSDEECERLTGELMGLDEQKNSSPEEKELAELLTVLIEEYEGRRYPIRKASPQLTLRHLMEAGGLTLKDLWKTFGSKGITSEVFHRKRSVSKVQAKKLAEFFHVSAELFI
jgi:HTH-type transcriptional regulator / antitoxin HigA